MNKQSIPEFLQQFVSDTDSLPPVDDQCIYLIVFDTSLSVSDLNDIAKNVLATYNKSLSTMLWQSETFTLSVGDPKQPDTLPEYFDDERSTLQPFLYGHIHFGENIEDEWLVVSILAEITKQYSDAVAFVEDGDGEFLAIEAAPALPEWLDPSTSTNRIALSQGKLHIVPSNIKNVTIDVAANACRMASIHTEASTEAQSLLQRRLVRLPNIPESLLQINCHVPSSVARMLLYRPQLVSLAVDAFYTRDAIDMKACARMDCFPPRKDDMRTIPVQMTECMYAQTVRQRMNPSKVWDTVIPSSASHHAITRRRKSDTDSNDYTDLNNPYLIGMKITCGLEILMCRGPGRPYLRMLRAIMTGTSIAQINSEAITMHQKAFAKALKRSKCSEQLQKINTSCENASQTIFAAMENLMESRKENTQHSTNIDDETDRTSSNAPIEQDFNDKLTVSNKQRSTPAIPNETSRTTSIENHYINHSDDKHSKDTQQKTILQVDGAMDGATKTFSASCYFLQLYSASETTVNDIQTRFSQLVSPVNEIGNTEWLRLIQESCLDVGIAIADLLYHPHSPQLVNIPSDYTWPDISNQTDSNTILHRANEIEEQLEARQKRLFQMYNVDQSNIEDQQSQVGSEVHKAADEVRTIFQRMSQFVESESGYEGADLSSIQSNHKASIHPNDSMTESHDMKHKEKSNTELQNEFETESDHSTSDSESENDLDKDDTMNIPQSMDTKPQILNLQRLTNLLQPNTEDFSNSTLEDSSQSHLEAQQSLEYCSCGINAKKKNHSQLSHTFGRQTMYHTSTPYHLFEGTSETLAIYQSADAQWTRLRCSLQSSVASNRSYIDHDKMQYMYPNQSEQHNSLAINDTAISLDENNASSTTFEEYFQAMRDELYADSNTIGSAFELEDNSTGEVNVPYNLIKNLAESVSSQAGTAGPASSLLQELGASVPQEWFAGMHSINESNNNTDTNLEVDQLNSSKHSGTLNMPKQSNCSIETTKTETAEATTTHEFEPTNQHKVPLNTKEQTLTPQVSATSNSSDKVTLPSEILAQLEEFD